MNHLDVRGLRFRRGTFSLEASLALGQGETGVILGPSGCGKTTLLRCVAGLERQEEGRISINGREIGNLEPERRGIGFIFQDLALFDHMTGRENIGFGLKLRKMPGAEASRSIDELAGKLQIGSLLDRRPFSMSGGEKQRLAFARAVAVKPEILLMDEPLSSLDAPLRRELRTYLRTTLSREGITALHVTHDVEEALELGDQLFLMKAGRILARGSPQTMYEDPPDAWCVEFLGLGALLPILRVKKRGEGLLAETPYGSYSCPLSSCRADGAALEGGNAFFYIPQGAAAPIARTATPAGLAAAVDRAAVVDRAAAPGGQGYKPLAVNVMEASVEGLVFQGNFRRLVLHPIRQPQALSGRARFGAAEGGQAEGGATGAGRAFDAFTMELKIGLGYPVARGERLRLSIDGERCGILPLHAGISLK